MPSYSLWIAFGLLVIAAILWKPLAGDRARVRTAFTLLILWGAAAFFAVSTSRWTVLGNIPGEVGRALLVLAAIQIGFLLVFDVALRRFRLPKFISEIAIVVAYIAALLQLLSRLGVNTASLFATSAVATAVVGLALQDMLSNIAGGMTLQLEDSINVGDYIRCGDHAGWVEHVRLRHTAILTSNGDTIVLPNSFLTRSPFVIVSKAHRHFVPFSMPYSYNPHEIIDAVETALRGSPLNGVAAEPRPRCLVRELAPGHIVYAAVVWMSNPGQDVEELSPVLNRIYYALERAGIPIAEISYLIERKAAAVPVVEASPEDILRRMPIFRLLENNDLSELAVSMKRLSFAPGEQILRQGDPGDSMYFVIAGRVGVSYRSPDGSEQDLASFASGDFFGEASLLTGEARSATATAISRVTCYCLDKAGLQRTMERQPELAEDMSVIMAHRQIELSAAREKLDRETALRREAESQNEMLARIRRFFGITGSTAGA